MKRIYLACPYTHEHEFIRVKRFTKASKKAAELMKNGDLVFSPISHGHFVSGFDVPINFETWADFNDSIIEKWATHVYVLMLDGWKDSKGVAHEVQLAEKLGLPIEYVEL